jgi:MFS transporter, ACS family, hexuronate transporter
VLGVGEAFNWPCATRIIANVLPPQDRGLGSGIFNSGAAVGSLVAPLLITPLALQFGWRVAFFAIGAVGLLWIPLWLWATRKTRVECAVAEQNPSARPGIVHWASDVFLRPGFWLLLVIGITVNPCWYFLNEWIPKYMHDARGLSFLSAGLVTIPIFVGGDLGNLLSGAVIKYLVFRGWSLRRARGTTLALAAALIAPATLLPLVTQTWIVVCILGFTALGITSFAANYTACQQDYSYANVGIVAGILGMSCNVVAAAVNPWIGRYVDATGNYTLIFASIGLLPAISLAAVVAFDALVHREGKPL